MKTTLPAPVAAPPVITHQTIISPVPAGFRNRLVRQMLSLPGSPERTQIADILATAEEIHLSDPAVAAIARLVTRHEGSIAQSLHHLVSRNVFKMPFGRDAIWLEFNHRPRFAAIGAEDTYSVVLNHVEAQTRMGCLIIREPNNPGHLVIMVAWVDGAGNIAHSYALLHWQAERLCIAPPGRWHQLLGWPRRLWRTDKSGNHNVGIHEAGRLYECDITIPPGFRSEMEIMNDIGDPETMARAIKFNHKISMGENVFLMAAMLFLESTRADFLTLGETGQWEAQLIGISRKWTPAKLGFFGRGVLNFGLQEDGEPE